jgi:hypothetical protein
MRLAARSGDGTGIRGAALLAFNHQFEARHFDWGLAHRHAVDDPPDSASGPELGLEDQRVLAVSAPQLLHRAGGLGRSDPQESVSLVAEHRGETRGGVKARTA